MTWFKKKYDDDAHSRDLKLLSLINKHSSIIEKIHNRLYLCEKAFKEISNVTKTLDLQKCEEFLKDFRLESDEWIKHMDDECSDNCPYCSNSES